jgi:hypothetical protein
MAARMATKPSAPLAIWMCAAAPVAEADGVAARVTLVLFTRAVLLLCEVVVAFKLAVAKLPVTRTVAVIDTVLVVVVVELSCAKTARGRAMSAKLEKRILTICGLMV